MSSSLFSLQAGHTGMIDFQSRHIQVAGIDFFDIHFAQHLLAMIGLLMNELPRIL